MLPTHLVPWSCTRRGRCLAGRMQFSQRGASSQLIPPPRRRVAGCARTSGPTRHTTDQTRCLAPAPAPLAASSCPGHTRAQHTCAQRDPWNPLRCCAWESLWPSAFGKQRGARSRRRHEASARGGSWGRAPARWLRTLDDAARRRQGRSRLAPAAAVGPPRASAAAGAEGQPAVMPRLLQGRLTTDRAVPSVHQPIRHPSIAAVSSSASSHHR
jgi:hypothetical protein